MKLTTTLSLLAALCTVGIATAQTPEPRPQRPQEIQRGDGPPPPNRQRGDRPHRPDEMMRRADTNGDGKLSFEELSAARPEATRERFNRMDRNGDGFLTAEDRPEGRRGPRGDRDGRQEMARQVLETDANGDGKVSYEELDASKPGFPKDAFARIDRNGDGFVSEDELRRPERGPNDRPQRPTAGDRSGRGGPSPEQRAAMRERLMSADANGDGRLSQSEATSKFPRMTAERFQRLDRNGDGFFSSEDRQGPPPRSNPPQ